MALGVVLRMAIVEPAMANLADTTDVDLIDRNHTDSVSLIRSLNLLALS